MSMVSVIVPVYNNTYYLKECVDSILAQTYFDIELILVDDGSNDECARLCDSYSDKASVYHKKNGGVSSARNFGLDKARGEFICFVDSDDIVSPLYIETLVEMCTRNNVPLAACSYKTFTETVVIPTAIDDHQDYLFSGEDRWRSYFRTDTVLKDSYGTRSSRKNCSKISGLMRRWSRMKTYFLSFRFSGTARPS